MTAESDTTEILRTGRPEDAGRDGAIAEMLTNPTRRLFLGAAAVPAAAMVGALPTAADDRDITGIEHEDHPDHCLLALRRAHDVAEQRYRAASDAHAAALDRLWGELGPCPSVLRVGNDDYGSLTSPVHWPLIRGIGFRFMDRFDDDQPEAGTRVSHLRSEAWTPKCLQKAIAIAVPVFGTGGTTPNRIRRYRSLLPIAEEYFGRHDQIEARLGVAVLAASSREAGCELTRISEDFSRTPAVTLAGLTIIAARMNHFSWEGMHCSWRNLLRSAAAVTGVAMREPRYDVERFISRLERAGGRWIWNREKDEGGVSFPIDHRHRPDQKAELRELSHELEEFRAPIRQWMRDRAWEA